jgi:hypothetical protein
MTTERFHLGDLLSITDGRLLSPTGMGGVHRLVDFVTGEQHMTHQLPRTCDVVKAELLRQHSWLADVEPHWVMRDDDPDDPPGPMEQKVTVLEALWKLCAEYGEFHDVHPMPFGAYVGREPIAELQEMAPHMEIIAVEVDGGDV